MPSIYVRTKNSEGQWRYQRIKQGRGIRTGELTGPFYVRHSALTRNGKAGQLWRTLAADKFTDAQAEAEKLSFALEAQSQGLTVAEAEAVRNTNRVPLRIAVDSYLEQKSGKARKTVLAYTAYLNEFLQTVKVHFIDEVTENVLRGYKRYMQDQGYAGKTIDTRINIVYFLLKKYGVTVRLAKDEMPPIEEEPAVPYTDEELKKLFAVMTPEETIRYKFFLGTGCRDKEVSFATWNDIDFSKSKYHVRAKPDLGFTLKNHESRDVPLPASLVAMLKERRENQQHPRWIFVNAQGNPDNHFLRKLKSIAKRAGLNCGHCKTIITEGKYDNRKQVEVSCATRPVCEHFYLHRFRKTCATRWHEHHVPLDTIRRWLGHKNLATTQIYLGASDDGKYQNEVNKSFGD